jgi:hypothetical protein
MGELPELWSDRFVREFAGFIKLWKSSRWLAAAFLIAIAFYGWHLFGPPVGGLSSYALTDKAPPTTATKPPVGATGWIYVGSRDDSGWKKFEADGNEPMRTLDTDDLPRRSMIYTVSVSVYLRDTLPEARTDARPLMSDSKGTIFAGSQVKVDEIAELTVPNPPRIWVWAHVTLTEGPSH